MKKLFFLSSSLLFFASCNVATPTEAVDATRPSVAPEPIRTSAQVSEVDGLSFRVLVADDGKTALVGTPSQRGSFSGADVEAAAQQNSGCGATIVPGEWAFLGDLKQFELSNLRPNVRRPFPAWQVELSC